MVSRVRGYMVVLAIITVLCLLNLFISPFVYHEDAVGKMSRRHRSAIPKPSITDRPSVEAPLVVVVCDVTGGNTSEENLAEKAWTKEGSEQLRNSWTRQTEQLSTMFETLLYFSKSTEWRIIVLTDTTTTFQRVLEVTESFRGFQRSRLQLENRNIWFPEEYKILKDHWRPCAWAKLFLAEALPEEDAVIYLDTDVVFLGPAEQLWSLLRLLEDGAALALAPEPQYLLDNPGWPYAGRAGLNTGMMAANLTRLRQLPGGGLGSAILRAGAINPPPRHDQDALNHFLIHKPYLLKEVSSRWNFLISSCFPVAPPCPTCVSLGILVLHGSDVTFYRHVDRKFLVMYSSLLSLRADDKPRSLLAKIDRKLSLVDFQYSDFPCTNYSHLNHALTLGLRDMSKYRSEVIRLTHHREPSHNSYQTTVNHIFSQT
ncbi:glucoside xylosyltransferase 1-like [Panulirus ornatus]|uniref:glucoside xylosyltransferase 1-like n=1 Tax=Panulirus ornatus TaxID=150431 RepID=UPI003A838AB8